MSKWVINGLATAIIAVWVASMVGYLVFHYQPHPSVQVTISLLAGAAFGNSAVRAAIGSRDNGKPSS